MPQRLSLIVSLGHVRSSNAGAESYA